MVSLKGHRVYLDASTIIYALEGVPAFGNLLPGLLVPMDRGEFYAVTSAITLVETIVGPRKKGDLSAEQELRAFITSSATFTVAPITSAILEKVIDLRTQYTLKIPDAIHLATGMLLGCDLFVTGDQAWAKTGVTIVEPTDIV